MLQIYLKWNNKEHVDKHFVNCKHFSNVSVFHNGDFSESEFFEVWNNSTKL